MVSTVFQDLCNRMSHPMHKHENSCKWHSIKCTQKQVNKTNDFRRCKAHCKELQQFIRAYATESVRTNGISRKSYLGRVMCYRLCVRAECNSVGKTFDICANDVAVVEAQHKVLYKERPSATMFWYVY